MKSQVIDTSFTALRKRCVPLNANHNQSKSTNAPGPAY